MGCDYAYRKGDSDTVTGCWALFLDFKGSLSLGFHFKQYAKSETKKLGIAAGPMQELLVFVFFVVRGEFILSTRNGAVHLAMGKITSRRGRGLDRHRGGMEGWI
jgi:hypothetical protein